MYMYHFSSFIVSTTMKRNFVIAVCLSILYLECGECAMSMAQMKAALKLVRNVCQPKSKVTDEDIDNMHKGNWDLGKPAQCYMRCGMDMYKMMTKDHNFDFDAAINTMKAQAPDEIRDSAIASFTKCKDSVKTHEKCPSAFELAKCVYFADPEAYFLP